ncbi:hypothetical protein SODALDRAFT_358766 [Sodiomyces alkalinus F11]|uniref:Uncharacterized protein n=1 Tax=Sodiomyces alkalinus (strain CBS 110278 / VKM F-3762 / F11) TaxID=1314773 RepID=A0A3N2PX65_SODAK|nr:hypothetical protein SODALDRAFT_358766 [Sodiomyces alkalinus F11]ROT38935.1 hypothetical protein SODALDRAFT_358766 [Sodiomyces alkalinus F11]
MGFISSSFVRSRQVGKYFANSQTLDFANVIIAQRFDGISRQLLFVSSELPVQTRQYRLGDLGIQSHPKWPARFALKQSCLLTEALPSHSLSRPLPQASPHLPQRRPPRHASFSNYRDHVQQHGPLQKSIRSSTGGIGGSAGAQLGDVQPPKGTFFDTSELPARFRRAPIEMAEIEAVESGGAAVFG